MEVITSRNNDRIKEIVKLTASASYRRQTGLFVAEGENAATEVLLSGAVVRIVLFTKNAAEKYSNTIKKISEKAQIVYEISGEVCQKISETSTPQGLFCVCEVIDNPVTIDTIDNNGRVILLENIQDPGNLGTILRTALAFSMDAVVIAGGCDIYSPKVIRATAGTVFKTPFCIVDNAVEAVSALKNRGISTYASVPARGNTLYLGRVPLSGGCAVVIGNEGAGITAEVMQACDSLLTIPMSENAESLNAAVAASVIMWEMSKDGERIQ